MYVGRRYPLKQTLHWSRMDWFLPLVWSALVHDRQAKRARTWSVPPESTEDLRDVLAENLSEQESDYVLSKINPAAHLLGEQSRDLAELRRQGSIDGFTHVHLQELLQELMTQQGKAERIKNFPFPLGLSDRGSHRRLVGEPLRRPGARHPHLVDVPGH